MVLHTLFDSATFWSHSNYQTQFKTPYQYVVSLLRTTATPVRPIKPVDGVLNQLGQPLYGWLTPEGYNFSEETWLNLDALLRRINFVNGLSNGKSPIASALAAQHEQDYRRSTEPAGRPHPQRAGFYEEKIWEVMP